MDDGVPLILAVPRSRTATAAATLRACGEGLRRFGRTSGPACSPPPWRSPRARARRPRRSRRPPAWSARPSSPRCRRPVRWPRPASRTSASSREAGSRPSTCRSATGSPPGRCSRPSTTAQLRRALEQQQAQLDAQRAVLDRLVDSTTVQGAQNSVEQAQAILDATEDQVAATREADESALKRAEKQLDFDEDARDDAEDQLDADEDACGGRRARGTRRRGRSPPRSRGVHGEPDGDGGARGVEQARDADAGPTATTCLLRSTSIGARGTDGASTGSAPAPGTGTGTTTPGSFSALTAPVDPVGSGACSRIPSDQSALARPSGRSSPAAPPATPRGRARRRRRRGRVSIENARQGVVSAQNGLDSSAHRPAVDDRPAAGGDRRPGGGGAPGAAGRRRHGPARARRRDGVGAQRGGRGVPRGQLRDERAGPGQRRGDPRDGRRLGRGGHLAVARPGGTQFLVLDGVDTFQVVVPFAEADASRIAAARTSTSRSTRSPTSPAAAPCSGSPRRRPRPRA